jgi:hypothetical protein
MGFTDLLIIASLTGDWTVGVVLIYTYRTDGGQIEYFVEAFCGFHPVRAIP